MGLRIIMAWAGLTVTALMAGVAQAFWNFYHGLPWGPFDTLGAPVSLALLSAGVVAFGVAAIIVAIRGFD